MKQGYWLLVICYCLMAAVLTASCVADDAERVLPTDGKVAVELALNVATPSAVRGATRMSATTTQNNGFRGVQDLWLVPFAKGSVIVSGDTPLNLIQDKGEEISIGNGAAKYFFNPDAMRMQIGTASFLAYGRAEVNGNDFANGSLTASYTTDTDFTPANVTFTPVGIPADDGDATKAAKIAEYLTNIAKAGNWYHDNDTKELFYEFANIHNSVAEPFAGSSINILKHINKIYQTVTEHMADGVLKTAILAAITDNHYVTFEVTSEGTVVTALKGNATKGDKYDMTAYPANLPDGVAGMWWNGTSFESKPGNNFDSYAYPAELYYYANSQIYTSTQPMKDKYVTTATATEEADTWATFIAKYRDKTTNEYHTTVAADTRSIALIDPLQYGVACLEVQIQAKIPTGGGTNKIYAFDDNYGSPSVELKTSESDGKGTFPLTAILVGGQHIQGFDFTPKYPDEETASTDPEYIIYDRQIEEEGVCLGNHIKGETDNYSNSLYTLTLQTKKEQSVKLVLEFKNNSGSPFKCKSGIIYPDTKFYLMASVVNLETSDEEKDQQVLTKDHKSTVLLTISNLSNAYNALPSLSSDKVRVFETVTAGISTWQTGSSPSTEIYNW